MASKGSSSNVRQLVLIAILALGAYYLFYSYWISPTRTELATVEGQIQGLEAEVAQARAQQAQLPELLEQVRQSQGKLETLRRVLPNDKETAAVVRKVQELAVRSNLHLKSFAPQETVQHDFYQDWPILLSVEGNFDSLGTFLEKVSRFPRIIKISNLTIRPLGPDQRTRTRTLAATCTATTYVFQEVSDDS